jgi:hypothetical protein
MNFMTAVQALAVVIIRLWAVGALISALFGVSQMAGLVASGDEMYRNTPFGYLQLATYLLILAFWILVLAYSRRVTMWLVPPVKEADHAVKIEPADLIRIGSFLIGVYYLTQYVPDFMRTVSAAILESRQTGMSYGRAVELAVSIIAILIALWLILRTNHLARLFAWLRRAGQPGQQQSDNEAKVK